MRFLRFTMLALLLFLPAKSFAQVPEIPNPALPDIAMVSMTPMGPVIYYNPIYCMQLGYQVCNFYRAHEYGHIALGHALSGNFPQVNEFQADCWAAQNADPSFTLAAFRYFASGGGSTPIHGTGQQRAARVRACAIQAGRWTGP